MTGSDQQSRPDAHSIPAYATLEEWIAREALPFALDSTASLNAAVDRLATSLGEEVRLLGFGEALHGGEDILMLRNRLFQRLAEAHGYSAIAIESSMPRGRLVNAYVTGAGPAAYEDVRDSGFSHGSGLLDANRELVEWMRAYNADPAHRVKLHFYGFDMPGVTGGPASPRQVLYGALDCLSTLEGADAQARRERIDQIIGHESRWENPMPWYDPAQSPELVASATALRLETEDLAIALRTRRPDLMAQVGADRYLEALHDTVVSRELLNFYVGLAGGGYTPSLSVRDALMADNLAYIVAREQGRGKVLVFAHNSHLQRGKARVQFGPELALWWPAGAHLHEMLGARYAVISTAVGVSEDNGIGRPEAGTLEARLTAVPGPARFIPTHRGQGLPAAEIAALEPRSRSARNPTYIPALPSQVLSDVDWLAALDSTAYNRGGRPLP